MKPLNRISWQSKYVKIIRLFLSLKKYSLKLTSIWGVLLRKRKIQNKQFIILNSVYSMINSILVLAFIWLHSWLMLAILVKLKSISNIV